MTLAHTLSFMLFDRFAHLLSACAMVAMLGPALLETAPGALNLPAPLHPANPSVARVLLVMLERTVAPPVPPLKHQVERHRRLYRRSAAFYARRGVIVWPGSPRLQRLAEQTRPTRRLRVQAPTGGGDPARAPLHLAA